MAITVKYGTFSFPANEPEVTVDKRFTFGVNDARETEQASITISGKIQAGGTTILANTDAMLAALATDGLDFVVQEGTDDVTHLTYHGSDCITPPRITNISFPEGSGPELATGGIRTYRVTMEAEKELANPNHGTFISFRESVTVAGGGSHTQVIETLTGTALVWPTSTYSVRRCTQEGEAVGRTTWPSAPTPLFSADRVDLNPVRYDSPEYVHIGAGGTAVICRMFRTSWSYEFASGNTAAFGTARAGTWAS